MSSGGFTKTDSGRKKARIEIIPLIDVIFFLLATFVLFTLSLNKIKSLPLTLPVSEQKSYQKPNPDDVTIQVSDGDTLYWNKSVLPMQDLPANLESYKKQVATPRILVTGDDKAKHGNAIRVLDEIIKARGIQYSVETKIRGTGQ